MAMQKQKMSWVLAFLLLAQVGPFPVQAQEGPSVNWEAVSPAEFATAADSWFASNSPPVAEDQRRLAGLAWERFLDDPEFIGTGDWQDVSRLSAIFGSKWPLLEESAVSHEVPPRVIAFREALKARLEAVPSAEFSSLAATDRAMVSAGLPRSDLAPRAAQWMQSADWQALSFGDRVSLTGLLHAEIVPVRRFSVRWTGVLVPSRSGQYVFEQLRQHHIDVEMRVTLGADVVLDSAALPAAEQVQVRSEPVALEAGERMPIVVEYRYDAESMQRSREFLERIFPMAVLAWQRGDERPEIIPAEVFEAPDGVKGGLLGEYFASTEFDEPVGARVDPGVQMVWSKQQSGMEVVDEQILSSFADKQSQVIEDCANAILHGDALVGVNDSAQFYESDLPRLLQRLSARQRLAILEELTQLPESLDATSPLGVRFILPHVFMLSPEAVGDYLAAWVERRDVDLNSIREYPGWGAESFNRKTYDDYGWVGHFVRGANWPIAERLLEEHLQRDDGSCNLMVAYCVGMAAVFDGKSEQMIAILEEQLDNAELTGDVRATWLLARAFLEEINVGGMPRPGRGMEFLEEASLLAEGDEMRFRIFQEIIARYGSAGVVKRATPLLDDAEGRFPEHAAEIAVWRRQLAAIEARLQSPKQ